MGRRVNSRKPPIKPNPVQKLPTTFNCPFCENEKSCEVIIDKKAWIGNIICIKCGEQFQTVINYLSQPIDVYNDWIDACEEAN